VYSAHGRLGRVLAIAACLVASSAGAQGTEPTQAEKLFEEGKGLLREKKVDEACDKLDESQRLDPAVGTLGLLAYCREMQERTATAWRTYLLAAEMAEKGGDAPRAKVARERAAALEGSLSRVRIQGTGIPKGFVLTCDDRVFPEEEWDSGLPADPGPIEIVARAPGFQPWSVQMDLAKGASLTIRVPALQPVVEQKPPEQVPIVERTRREPNFVPGAVVGGAGVLLLGVGSYFGLRAISKNDASKEHCVGTACNPEGGELRDDAKQAATVSTVTIGLGLVGVGVGAVLLMGEMNREDQKQPAAAVRVAPEVGPGVAGIGVRGVF
jgi:hypothetical protein